MSNFGFKMILPFDFDDWINNFIVIDILDQFIQSIYQKRAVYE